VVPPVPSGILAKYTALDIGQGAPHCPWKIQGKPGQTIHITLWNFAVTAPMHTNNVADDRQSCEVFASLRETEKALTSSICSRPERISSVYTSVTSEVEIRMMGNKQINNTDFFLLQYDSKSFVI
jgi:hypothetical protein